MAVRPDARSISSAKPRFVCAAHRFSHLASLVINWAKFGSSESLYTIFWRQFSNVLTVSVLVRHHCLGARCILLAMLRNYHEC